MKKIDLGETITIFANIGVIAGIVFLAMELHQNNQLLHAQAGYALAQNRAANGDLLKSSPEFAELLAKLDEGQELTRAEQFQEMGMYLTYITNWAWEFGEYQEGRISDAQLPVAIWQEVARGNGPLPGPRFHETWESVKSYYDPAFVEFMETAVVAE